MGVPRDQAIPNLLLRQAREVRQLTQDELADGLLRLGAGGVTGGLVSKWERGVCRPSAFHRRLICQYLDSTEALPDAAPTKGLLQLLDERQSLKDRVHLVLLAGQLTYFLSRLSFNLGDCIAARRRAALAWQDAVDVGQAVLCASVKSSRCRRRRPSPAAPARSGSIARHHADRPGLAAGQPAKRKQRRGSVASAIARHALVEIGSANARRVAR